MEKYRVHYDRWFLESDLHKDGEVMAVVNYLRDRGLTYEKDGAVWYKATEFGGEKDEVLVRANGNPTYFTADIAYHKNKFDRGFDLLIDIWGSDHHGHVARMKGAIDAIGQSADKLDIILMQFVRLMRDGQPVRMSKRTGKAIQLGDLLDEVPVDSARFLFNMREANSLLDFDLDLAVQQIPRTPCTTSSTPTRVFAASCAHWKPRASPRATAPQRSSALLIRAGELELHPAHRVLHR